VPRARVFISHASQDFVAANMICSGLEALGMQCWIAPRDIGSGKDWPAEITAGLESSDCLIVLISDRANASRQIVREVTFADGRGVHIVPIHIDQVLAKGGLKYLTGAAQRIDAFPGSIESHLPRIAAAVSGTMPDSFGLQRATEAMKDALPGLLSKQWRLGSLGWRGIAYAIAANRQNAAQRSRLTEQALRIADTIIAQAIRQRGRVLPRLFQIAWPATAVAEAIILFPFFAYLLDSYAIRFMDWMIIETTSSAGRMQGIEAIAKAIGLPRGIVDLAIYILPVPVAYAVCLLVVDRMMAMRKGLAIVPFLVIPIWSIAASALTRDTGFDLPRHIGWPRGFTSPEIMGMLAFAIALVLHSKAIWIGIADRGFVGRTMRYKRLLGRRTG